MYFFVPEVENFESKSKKLTNIMDRLFRLYGVSHVHIDYLKDVLGLNSDEMNNIVFYLKRGHIINTDMEHSLIKLTPYGRMIYCESKNIPSAPIIG